MSPAGCCGCGGGDGGCCCGGGDGDSGCGGGGGDNVANRCTSLEKKVEKKNFFL